MPNDTELTAHLRGEGREQGGGDEPGCVVRIEPPGGGVLGRGVHEAVGGGDQPLLRQVAAEGPGALSMFDEGLHAAQDPVVNAADPLGRELALRGWATPSWRATSPGEWTSPWRVPGGRSAS